MNNPWKLATLALALVGVTSLSTGVTTAYLLRPNTTTTTDMATAAPAYAAPVTRARRWRHGRPCSPPS
ncbi:MAG: hypothetical protein FJZ38_04285 [Candidatus Rokubacteria bacterium]|nr:hypothetical protein [Candidatus Rokubacteria bacterium]